MDCNIDAAAVVAFHDRQLRNPDWPIFDDAQSGCWTWIAANHRHNGLLWREEDRARLSSETAGATIGRLSSLALKIHHMRAQAQREARAGRASGLNPWLYGKAQQTGKAAS